MQQKVIVVSSSVIVMLLVCAVKILHVNVNSKLFLCICLWSLQQFKDYQLPPDMLRHIFQREFLLTG